MKAGNVSHLAREIGEMLTGQRGSANFGRTMGGGPVTRRAVGSIQLSTPQQIFTRSKFSSSVQRQLRQVAGDVRDRLRAFQGRARDLVMYVSRKAIVRSKVGNLFDQVSKVLRGERRHYSVP